MRDLRPKRFGRFVVALKPTLIELQLLDMQRAIEGLAELQIADMFRADEALKHENERRAQARKAIFATIEDRIKHDNVAITETDWKRWHEQVQELAELCCWHKGTSRCLCSVGKPVVPAINWRYVR
jgi:glucokinase